jgi:hypothetical protein
MCLPVQRSRRSAIIRFTVSAVVGRRSFLGRDERSVRPARPSALWRASHLRAVRGQWISITADSGEGAGFAVFAAVISFVIIGAVLLLIPASIVAMVRAGMAMRLVPNARNAIA